MRRLKSISPEDGVQQWNSFILQHQPIPPISFNPSLLNFFSSFFNWKPYYFLIYNNRQHVGIFPLIDTGRKFVSLPHFSYGGLILSDTDQFNSPVLIRELIQLVLKEKPTTGFLACQVAEQGHVQDTTNVIEKKLFIRSLWDFKGATKSNKVCSLIQLPETNTEMLKLLSSNLRRKLRKTAENGLETKQGRDELLDDFYGVYAHNMHRLGSPAFSKFFFQDLFENYKNGHVRIFLSEINNKTIGAAFLMSYNGFFENTWFSTNRKYKSYLVSDHLHWQMIQFSIQQKGKVYSMGRSTLSEKVHHYKSHWPVMDYPLFTWDNSNGLQLKNQKWLAHLWKRIPFPLTKLLGPGLVKHIY